jgi:hypothetical protein
MKFLLVVVAASLIIGCSESIDENTWTVDPASDSIAFTKTGEEGVYQMQLDGKNLMPLEIEVSPRPKWEGQERHLNNACGRGESEPDDPITIISPDGAFVSALDDSWTPALSSDGTKVAVACAVDVDGKVVVVSNFEKRGSKEENLPEIIWSREGRGILSDRMEIYIFSVDGSAVTKLTRNGFGDWLPRWNPVGSDFESEVGESILIESNRDGNSEIYLLATKTTDNLRLTENEIRDQSPVFSKNGYGAAFASELFIEEEGQMGIVVAIKGAFYNTKQKGTPVIWPD